MFLKLITLFFFAPSYLYAFQLPLNHQVEEFAYSSTWLKLFNYKRSIWSKSYKSVASEDKFFIASDGRTNPLAELKAAIEAIHSPKKYGHIQKEFPCAFPARYQRIKEKWPNLFSKKKCPELDDWIKKINPSQVFIVYAGSFPNNPASMFGHSFIRFANPNNNHLLDYTLGFSAKTDVTDNPLIYAGKGLSGGYTGFYQIDPYYLNLGIYNHSESRSLWEYQLQLSTDEIRFLLMHIWEISLNTGFPYYFLNENCSYYLLTLLEATRPDVSFPSQKNILLHPIEAIKDVVEILGVKGEPPIYRGSIQEQFFQKVQLLEDPSLVLDVIQEQKIPENIDVRTLDALIDYWNHRNFKMKANLSKRETEHFQQLLAKRAEILETVDYPELKGTLSPVESHDPSKFELGTYFKHKAYPFISWDWGYHSLQDNHVGFDRTAYIDYFGFKMTKVERSYRIEELNYIKIDSLENFEPVYKKWSWHINLSSNRSCYDCKGELGHRFEGGVGLAQTNSNRQFWASFIPELFYHDSKFLMLFKVRLGAKLIYKKFSFLSQLESFSKDDMVVYGSKNHLNYTLGKNKSISFGYLYNKENIQKNLFKFSLRVHY